MAASFAPLVWQKYFRFILIPLVVTSFVGLLVMFIMPELGPIGTCIGLVISVWILLG